MQTRFAGRETLFTTLATAIIFGAGLLLAPVLAHHASGPFYDPENRVDIQGTVTRFVFRNPHAYLFVEVPDADGELIEWQVELGAPGAPAAAGRRPGP